MQSYKNNTPKSDVHCVSYSRKLGFASIGFSAGLVGLSGSTANDLKNSL